MIRKRDSKDFKPGEKGQLCTNNRCLAQKARAGRIVDCSVHGIVRGQAPSVISKLLLKADSFLFPFKRPLIVLLRGKRPRPSIEERLASISQNPDPHLSDFQRRLIEMGEKEPNFPSLKESAFRL